MSWICQTCCIEYSPANDPPDRCAICFDERQTPPAGGKQVWTTMRELSRAHRVDWREQEPGLIGIGVEPAVGIGQRSLFLEGPGGGVLWDCTPLVDDDIVDVIRQKGGVRAMAVSHPHFFGAMVSWSKRLGGVPIYIHDADRKWIPYSSNLIRLWSGEKMELAPGLTLIHCGGHFAGSTVLHWSGGSCGAGALLTGDTVSVLAGGRWLAFMRGYPTFIPLSTRSVRQIAAAVAGYNFDRIYGGWWDRVVSSDGKGALERSVKRYLRWIEE